MDTRLSDAERISEIAKRLLVEQRRYAKIHERSCGELTSKQAQKVAADLNWQAFHIVKIESELHAACVDAGLADLRDAASYAPRPVRFDGWHTYNFTPALPKRLAAQAA